MKQTLPLRDLDNLAACLASAFEGVPEPIRKPDGEAVGVAIKPAAVPWAVRLAVARNLAALRPVIDARTKARAAIIAGFSTTGRVEEGDPSYAAAVSALTAADAEAVEVDLHPIRLGDIDKVDMPPTLLAGLLPVLKE